MAVRIKPGSFMTIPFKSRPVEFHQHPLFPSNISDLLPLDHECYLYAELFEQLDTANIESLYSVKGQHAYFSGNNLHALKQVEVDAYIATDKGEKNHKTPLEDSERKLVKADFIYDEASNTFTCPGGQTLSQISESKDGSRVYQGRAEACAECPFKQHCCQSEKGQARTISTDDKESLRLLVC
jgi:hypothetical protein